VAEFTQVEEVVVDVLLAAMVRRFAREDGRHTLNSKAVEKNISPSGKVQN